MEVDEIRRVAVSFRKAIEKAKTEGHFSKDVRFKDFPKGCCDDASFLLSEYLLKYDIQCKIVEGTYYDDNPEWTRSHGWIALNNGTIIDITGDQFKYNEITHFSKEVYVGKMTSFHKKFNEEMFTEPQGIYSEHKVRYIRLKQLYRIICENLEEEL